MSRFQKKIVTDESMNPVAVLIDYQDWQKIEKILEEHQSKINFAQYKGTLQLTEEPLQFQKRIRNEWT